MANFSSESRKNSQFTGEIVKMVLVHPRWSHTIILTIKLGLVSRHLAPGSNDPKVHLDQSQRLTRQRLKGYASQALAIT
jgi:hypothetical protein